jgi:hypothetical protein
MFKKYADNSTLILNYQPNLMDIFLLYQLNQYVKFRLKLLACSLLVHNYGKHF